jgi:predicted amidohydrolase
MKVALVQSSPRLMAWEETKQELQAALQRVGEKKIALAVLPELASTGYLIPSKDALKRVAEPADGTGTYLEWIQEQCAVHSMDIITGFAESHGKIFYNSSALVGPEGVLGVYRKLHLFSEEQDLFTPGNHGVPVIERHGVRLAMLICYDWAFPEAWRLAAVKGADVILHCSNLVLPYAQRAVIGHALCNRVSVLTANRVGEEKDLTFTGQSQAVDAFGNLLIQGPTASTWESVFEIDPMQSRDKSITARNDLFADRRLNL